MSGPGASPGTTATPMGLRLPGLDKLRTLPKPLLLGAAAALVALIVAVALWSRGPEYRVLFSNLDERDGGAIVSALSQMNVPYRFAGEGGALMVPADRVHETRLQLAGQGLPRGGSVGFELLDNARFGASQFAEQVNYQRGLEGELARSIEALHAVQRARVHLALPRQTLFVRERQAPTASVLLNLYAGRRLGPDQVTAISWLVSSSVPELAADQVSIVDQNGRLLSAPGGEGRGMDADQLRYVRDIEQRTAERILAILNPVLGSGNVHAQVSADIDFDRREQTSEVYRPNQEPGQAAVRSQQTSDSSQHGVLPAQGVPGALTNQPPVNATAPITAQAPAADAAGNAAADNAAGTVGTPPAATVPGQSRRDATTNYEVDRTISHVRQSVGQLRRLSVAVVVNYVTDEQGKPRPLPTEDLDKLTNLAREAMGFSAERGDTLNVANSPFTDSDPTPVWYADPGNHDLAKTWGGYLLLALLALWAWRSLIRPLVLRYTETSEQEQADQEAAREDARREAAQQARARQISRHEDNLNKARELAAKDPRAVAMVIRGWMESNGK